MSTPMRGMRCDEGYVVEPLGGSHRDPAPPLPQGTLDIDAVPAAAKPQPVPLLRILMPIIMVAALVLMVGLMVVGSGALGSGGGLGGAMSPMMLIFPLMMLLSMAMMFMPQGQQADADDTRRAYLRHLAAVREDAESNATAQRAHNHHRHPHPDELFTRLDTRRLWERAPGEADVLEVRLGLGEADLCTPVQVADSGAPEDLDPVCAVSVRHTVANISHVGDIPVVVQLQAFSCLGLAGVGARDLARALVAQLVVHHGPECVGIAAHGGEGEWDWLKWLPHNRNPHQAAHRILLVDNLATTGTEDFLADDAWSTIVDIGTRGTTALGVRAEMEGLVLSVDHELIVHTAAGTETLGTPDAYSTTQAVALAKALAKYTRPHVGTSAETTVRNDLASLLGLHHLDELDEHTMWPGRYDSRNRLTVPIGISPDKVPVTLDLKESAHGGMGPHGLCIGATGSGKSELLRTLVTALAATHSPDELNFVLVDFKGGATFLGCDALPHTSAVITNLDDEAVLVERMFDALSGEMNRRQEILRSSGNFANVDDYTNARLHGRDDFKPLPALVIIVDEFSELLGQFPDFADLFVAIGRLGRSLHVHLLLASQRLEEGRLRGLDSHLSYRIGLKTFSAMESRQVLGVTDAYHLPGKPGAGLLKTDAEKLSRFQGTYVSGQVPAPAVSSASPSGGDRRSGVDPCEVKLFVSGDATEPEPRRDYQHELTDSEASHETAALIEAQRPQHTTMEAVVKASVATAKVRKQSAHRIWLPPLPASIELAAVAERTAELSAGIGIVDEPYLQRQEILTVDLHAHSGHVALCGGPQMGKTTALRTIVASLAATHETAEISFYVIDLGGGKLESLARLPHVAGVAGRNQPERIRRIVDEVTSFIDNPQDHHDGADAVIRQVFLVIDGWHNIGTSTAEFEDLAEPITYIASDGPNAGIHLLISTPRWTTLRPAIRDLIGTRLELKLAESMDSLCDRKLQQSLPSLPGRGLNTAKKHVLIAQSSTQDIAHIAAVSRERGYDPVPALRMLPESISLPELVGDAPSQSAGIVLAVGGPTLSVLHWHPQSSDHLVCVGARGTGKTTTVRSVIRGVEALGRERARMVVIDHRRAHLGALDESMVAAYSHSAPATDKALREAAATLKQRLPAVEITAEQLARRDWWQGPEIYIVIDDLDLVSEAVLHPLVELIPHARDIGMHLVLARKSGGFNRASFGPALSAIKDSQPCVIVLGADKDDGPFFGIKPQPSKPAAHRPGRGIWHHDGANEGACQIAHDADDGLNPSSSSHSARAAEKVGKR